MTAPVEAGLTQPPTSSSTLSGTTPPANTPPSPPAEFRFGPEAEPWMQGKTAAEVNAIARELAELARRGIQQPPVQQQVPASQQLPALGADDLVTGAHIQQYGQQVIEQTRNAVNPAIEMAASTNLSIIQQEQAKVFAKYPNEVWHLLGNLPKQQWTIDNLRQVTRLVIANHLDDVVRERAEQLAGSGDPAIRATGASQQQLPTAQPSPVEQLTEGQRATLARNGVTLKTVEDFCLKNGMDVKRWFELYGKSAIGDAT